MDEGYEYISEEKLKEGKIADEVIAVCATNAALHTPGVSGLEGNWRDSLSKNYLKKESLFKGVKVDQTDAGIEIDIYLLVTYGYKIPQVAWDVQGNVKKEVETMVDREVLAVNIHVQGVRDREDD